MYESMITRKAHVLAFETSAGQMVIATDSLDEVANQAWFQDFLNIAGMRPQQRYVPQHREYPQPKPVPSMQQAQMQPMSNMSPQQQMQQMQQPVQPAVAPQQQRTFLDVNPFEMNDKVWNSLSPDQQNQWMLRYKDQLAQMQK